MRSKLIFGMLSLLFAGSHLLAQTPRFSVPVTFNDWFLYAAPAMPKDRGPLDVNYMMNKMVDEGVDRVYMRILNGGEVYSNSLLQSSFKNSLLIDKSKPDCNPGSCSTYYNFQDINHTFDQYNSTDFLEYSIDRGHSEGLEMYGWFSLMEEMHAGIEPRSWFADAHPQFLEKDSNDEVWEGRLSFAHPEVRAHKLSLIFDYVHAYDLDGVLLDFTRLGFDDFKKNIPNNVIQCAYMEANNRDQFGVSNLGYSVTPAQPVSNTDLNWINTRANYLNEFMADLKDTLSTISNRNVKINTIVLSTDHVTSKKGDLIDWGHWVSNDLVDGMAFLINNVTDGVMCGWPEFNDTPQPITSAKDIIAARRAEVNMLNPQSNIDVISAFFAYQTTPDIISMLNNYSISEGADEVMWWESHALQQQNQYDEYRWDLNNLYADYDIMPVNNTIETTTLDNMDLSLLIGETVEVKDVTITGGSHFFAFAGNEITFEGTFIVEDGSQFLLQQLPINGSNSGSRIRNLKTVIANEEGQVKNSDDMLILYPNPTKGAFKIKLQDEDEEIVTVKVFNTNGQILKTFQDIHATEANIQYQSNEKSVILVVYTSTYVTSTRLLFK